MRVYSKAPTAGVSRQTGGLCKIGALFTHRNAVCCDRPFGAFPERMRVSST